MEIDLVRLLEQFGHINPAIWDAIIPHGPREATSVGLASRASIFGFDPQPDPPGRQFLFAAATVAHEIAVAAVAAEASGSESGSRVVSHAVDDWCGTKPPHLPIPWPGPWPFPWAIYSPGPDSDWLAPVSRLVGGLSLASVASRLPEGGGAREALAKGAERLVQAALSDG